MCSKRVTAALFVASVAAHNEQTISWATGSGYASTSVSVGEPVTFVYSSSHDVWQFDDFAAYEACDFGRATNLAGRSDSPFTLNAPAGSSYYGCDVGSHCLSGNQKIELVAPNDELVSQLVDPEEVLNANDELVSLQDLAADDGGEMGVKVINGYPTNGQYFRGTVEILPVRCSGSFIGPNLVLSAAHCCQGYGQTAFTIRGGPTGNIIHGQSRRHRMGGSFPQNDICLIQLQSPHSTSYPNYDVFTTNVRSGANTYIAGYGNNRNGTNPTGAGTQRYGYTQIAGFQNNDVVVRSRPGQSPPQNGCFGDSGGPLFASVNGRWMVHGATSRGGSTCNPNENAFWVNTARNANWLRSTAQSWGLTDLNGMGGNCGSRCCYTEGC